MNFELKMDFINLTHFPPSIPSHGVVANSPLLFSKGGGYRL